MKATYTSGSGRIKFEFDCTTNKEAFATIAGLQELFEEPYCGCCQSTHIRCDVREYDKNLYYKLVCNDCDAQLDFGQYKDTARGLFVKRKDKDDREMPNRGWYVWGREDKAQSPAPAQPPVQSPRQSLESHPGFDAAKNKQAALKAIKEARTKERLAEIRQKYMAAPFLPSDKQDLDKEVNAQLKWLTDPPMSN